MRVEKVEKAIEITDAKIQFVSLVDKAANKRRFLLRKERDGQAVFSTYGRIIKADRENHYVTGIVYEPMEEDSHGNYMTAEEIRKAAYWFAKNGDKVDVQHSFEPLENAVVVETWTAKSDFEIGGEEVKEGTWLMTVEVGDPKVWESVEKGEITGFSMGGIGSYGKEDNNLNNITKESETEDKKGLLSKLAGVLGFNVTEKSFLSKAEKEAVEKSGKSISSKNREALQGIYDNLGMFLASFDSKEKEEPIKNDEGEQLKMTKKEMENVIAKSVSEALRKTLESEEEKTPEKPKKEEEITVNKDDLKKMIDEAVAEALKEKEREKSGFKEEEIQKMVISAVQKAVEPILKSKGLPNNLNGSEIEKSAEAHYLQGIL